MNAHKSLLVATMLGASQSLPDNSHRTESPNGLEGTWTLVAADLLLPDGTRTHDYGDKPTGLLIVDGQGRYTLQIYSSSRSKFASADKAKGTAAEFQSAILGCSTHFGRIAVDMQKHTFTLEIEGSTFPNQEGTQQKREFELNSDELSYRVQARPDGGIPISVWRRAR